MSWKRMTLQGWGRTARAETLASRPERQREVASLLAAPEAEPGLIAYGGGRSYGDAALNSGGATLLTQRLNRLLDFSPDTGLLVCEAGATFQDFLRTFLPRGYVAPVSPGTAFVTVGGAIAHDVHGKNHDHNGSFGDHLAWIELLLPDGRTLRASRDEEPELFAATIGGLGLTGVILRAAFRLQKAPSSHVVVRERRLPDLQSFMAAFAEIRRQATYSVGWIDGAARGVQLGRGILQTAEYATGAVPPASRARERRMPVDLPGIALNRHSVRLFNEAYFRQVPAAGRDRVLPLEKFLYPLDAILDWNRLYGRRGFYQLQCVLPDATAERGLPALMERIAEAGAASFLAVLKTLGRRGHGYLSFPMPGFTLALDLPARPGTPALMADLEATILDHGGRTYLAKDACLSPAGFRRMYPDLPRLQEVLGRVDPSGRMRSDMARRLQIHGAA
ncbi:FAD-binding protein [Teichococcus vastitatis]|uniref:FAD-binding oxidoreductase n=1 Tax=Teichococcus vastitatis TaxID=2307076 RepID=A0ABS9W9T2_9PROT|nr:FAD-binding oxidoreductase [Pseudoroseomonas vastitatis]MCI0756065.1 FAD-binding oxidoreductase [Pseudoroseomonas vastitatis]